MTERTARGSAGSRPAADRRTVGLEDRWRQVLEAAPEAYVAVDGDGAIRDWNRAAVRLFGEVGNGATRTPVTRLVPERHHPRLLQELRQAVLRPREQYHEPLQLELRTGAGAEFGAEWLVWGIDRRAGTLAHCFVRDVTERRRDQESSALLSAVVTGSADAIVTEGADGRIVTWNAAAERLFGWTADQVIGGPALVVVPEDEVERHLQLVADVLGGAPVRAVESDRTSRGGVRIPMALRMSPVPDASGRPVAVSTLAHDLTEQRWMAATLDDTLAQLQVAAAEAQASEEASRRFLADAAHQLRTPLSGIRACAELLLLGAPDADRDRLLATMVRETSRSARLITALLRIARLDQGQQPPPGRVDVAAVCRDEVERLSLLAPELDVVLEVADDHEVVLQLDAGSCQEIISNLADNARRHARTRIAFELRSGSGIVSLRVVDDGPGVAEPDYERVFERFVSLDAQGGSGLGLPIARGLARAMDGDLRYDDGFVLRLPVVRPE